MREFLSSGDRLNYQGLDNFGNVFENIGANFQRIG